MNFVENLEMIHIVEGQGGEGHVICIQKAVGDAPLLLNTFVIIEKMEPSATKNSKNKNLHSE